MVRLLLVACLAGAFAMTLVKPVPAAPGVQVGVGDDAWLEFGPGTLPERAIRLRELGVQVARVGIELGVRSLGCLGGGVGCRLWRGGCG